MHRLMTILMIISLTACIGWTDQTSNNFTIAEYFASNTLVAQNFINDIQSTKTIAVIEFKGKGITQPNASSLTEKLRTELFETGNYTVIGRETMNSSLAKNGFPVIGCTTKDCLAEAGRILEVSQVIGGSIAMVDNEYTVSAVLVSVEGAVVIKTAAYIGELEILTNIGMQEIAAELAATEIPIIQPEPQSPKAAESIQPQQAAPKFPVREDTVEQALFDEDLFQSSLTSDIYEFDTKSTKRAFFYSLLLPGAGEYYSGSKIKPIVFLGLEALLWTGYFVYNSKGDDIKTEYRSFADGHYNWADFKIWWDGLDSTDQQIFSHELPWNDEYHTAIRNHEYYENIGKYDQFQIGWDDIDVYPPLSPSDTIIHRSVISPHREFYLDLRKQSNDYYKTASTIVMLSLGNHIISAFDAALTAKGFNKGQKRYSFKLKTRDFGGETVPMLTCCYRF